MGARATSSRVVRLSAAAALLVPAACAGRSTTLGSENAGDGTGGATGGSAGTGGRGGTSAGASGGTGGAEPTGGTGGTGGTSVAGGTDTGAVGGTNAAGTGGTVAAGTGGTELGGAGGGPCAKLTIQDRECHTDADCQLTAENGCCGDVRLRGVNRISECGDAPVLCDAECAPRWLTDTNEVTFDRSVVRVRCEIGEPGAGVCVSFIDVGPPPPPTYCDGELCAPGEVCVHYAPPGGPPPPCELPFDGGGCAEGWELRTCPDSGRMGCVPVPPAPACAPAPASCGEDVSCDCLPADICGGVVAQCTGVTGRDVTCVDPSP